MEDKAVMKLVLRIKEAAKERGITLSSIAVKLGIHRSNMSAIASGARGASLKTLKKISQYYRDLTSSENKIQRCRY